MTLDECIVYLEHVSSERKPRSRKARQILNYLQELKDVKDNGMNENKAVIVERKRGESEK